MPSPEKPSKPSFLRRSRFRRGEAGSEFAGGRRSCDTDPRLSLDAGRMSVDGMGFSWDEPRASWDGYLFGTGAGIGLGHALPPPPPLSRLPPILSALEDSPAGIVERFDAQIPVEDDSQPEPDPDADVPGGSAQTRDYYLDTSSSSPAFSEPWPELRGTRGYNVGRMQRCNSNASARSSFRSNSGGGLGSSRRGAYVADDHVKRRREKCPGAAALERNRSVRQHSSPGGGGGVADNGLLRFYLTPVRSASGRWSAAVLPVKGAGRQLRSQSLVRTMLWLTTRNR